MKGLFWLVMVILAAFLVMSGCGQGVAPLLSPEANGPVAKVVTKPGWEGKWENTLAEARKEGVVRLYSLWGSETRVLLSQGFKARYGIELEFSPFARGSDLLAKVQAERRAGLYLADAFGAGPPTLLVTMKPEGLLGPFEPLLSLPEVTDPKLWIGGQIPFLDKERLAIGMLAVLQRHIVYNTDMVKEGEVTAYKDLLKPQYKGRIAMADPSLTGTANAMFGHIARDLWTVEEASDWLRQLIRQQEAVILREHRMVVEWTARGKYAIGLAGQTEAVAEFIKLGAPISVAVQPEGHFISSAGGGVSLAARPAHPSATAVFVNWLLGKEGQALFAVKGYGYPSLRLDVPAEGINPIFIVRPGEKVFQDSEELVVFRGEMLEVAKKVMDQASR
ncbi:MAG: extracellular solute-binding protein [Chloroflexi bacterium]|nr:extracellular solute-binding protein [Chloroflexota bacterium]